MVDGQRRKGGPAPNGVIDLNYATCPAAAETVAQLAPLSRHAPLVVFQGAQSARGQAPAARARGTVDRLCNRAAARNLRRGAGAPSRDRTAGPVEVAAWFYQHSLMFLAIAVAGRKHQESALHTCRFLVAATYFWSGLAKLNSSAHLWRRCRRSYATWRSSPR